MKCKWTQNEGTPKLNSVHSAALEGSGSVPHCAKFQTPSPKSVIPTGYIFLLTLCFFYEYIIALWNKTQKDEKALYMN